MYVILGATGNTGKIVVERLLAEGQKVRVVGRNAERLQKFSAAGAEPFVTDVGDGRRLTEAFTGAKAVYAMIPPDLKSKNLLAESKQITDSIAAALQKAGVKYVVALSSIGADKPDKTGPVLGLRKLEEKLNGIPGLNVLYLRAGYFMENTLGQAGTIHAIGKTAGPLRGDLKVPMIATHDIGEAAAAALKKLDFTGHQTRELQGQRDLTMSEVAAIIGKAIGKPDIEYSQLPDAQVVPVLMQLGMSESVASLLLEMSHALNSGYMKALETRSAKTTTLTSYEDFVAKVFLPVYQSTMKAA